MHKSKRISKVYLCNLTDARAGDCNFNLIKILVEVEVKNDYLISKKKEIIIEEKDNKEDANYASKN